MHNTTKQFCNTQAQAFNAKAAIMQALFAQTQVSTFAAKAQQCAANAFAAKAQAR